VEIADHKADFSISQLDVLQNIAIGDRDLVNKIKILFPIYGEEVHIVVSKKISSLSELKGKGLKEKTKYAINQITNKITGKTTSEEEMKVDNVNDLFIPEGGRPKVLSEGKIYQGIVGDEVAMGTNLSDAFTKVSTLQDLMSAKSKEGGTSQNIDGNLKIDINVGGRVDGDKNADMSKIFSSPQFQKQLMDMVLYKMKDYQKQQGVL
jgi:hypothetical protein